ncbi:hypothetical protein [Nocardioides sp. J54]|uniref:hypothetical protein n=1 Tax=Nocardioides sp. J54 TaxID=935866 RepID=UPI00048B0EB0|nr:hypothetical protein [Nocardioides sp. J54]
MSDFDEAACRARVEKATEGPWRRAEQTHGEWFGIHSEFFALGNIFDAPDAEFIAHARTDFPALLTLLDKARAELAEARGEHGGGWFMSQAEWADWSNDLARLVPEEYEADVEQEEIIERALADLVRRAKAAEGAIERVKALADERYGSPRWGLLRDGVRYVEVAHVRAALAPADTTNEGDEA